MRQHKLGNCNSAISLQWLRLFVLVVTAVVSVPIQPQVVVAQTAQPSAVVVNGLPACASGPFNVSFSWSGIPGAFGFYIDVVQEPNFQTNFWHKQIVVQTGLNHSVSAPAGFTTYDIATGQDLIDPVPVFQPNTRYYVRAVNGNIGAPVWGPVSSFIVLSCNNIPQQTTPPVNTVPPVMDVDEFGTIQKPQIVSLPACTNESYRAHVQWSGSRNSGFGFFVDIAPDAAFNSFWNRHVPTVMSDYHIMAPDNFNPYVGATGSLQLLPGNTYYVRVYNGLHSQISSFSVPRCGSTPHMPVSGANQKPLAHFDGISPDGRMIGWALDAGRPHDAIEVHFYFGGPAGSSTVIKGIGGSIANLPRADVNAVIGVPGNHGFDVRIPDDLRNGKHILVYAYAIDTDDSTGASNILVAGSPRPFALQPATTPVFGPSMYFDSNAHEFVLNDKTAMDAKYGKGIWLSNQRIKVYRNIHGSNWLPAVYAGKNLKSAFTLDPLDVLMPTFSGGGVVYVNDGTSIWSNNPYQIPVNEQKFESRVGLGYTKQGIKNNDLDLKVTYFVPSYDSNDPVIIQLVEATHTGNANKNYSFTTYQDIATSGQALFNQPQNALIYNATTTQDSWNNTKSSNQKLFLTSTLPIASYDTVAGSFLGTGTEANPAGVINGKLANSSGGGDNILAAQVNVSFSPNETKQFGFILGSYDSDSERSSLVSKYSNVTASSNMLADTKQFYLNKTSNIPGLSQRSPQLQTQLRLLGASALSTSMWWDNFVDDFTLNQMSRYLYDVNARDTAQISLGLNYLDPQLSRSGLETYIKSQQFTNGKIPYGMDSGSWRGPMSTDWGSDNIGWMAYAACEYVNVTGDKNWLNKSVTYRDDVTSDSIYRHIIRALNYDYNRLHPNGLVDTMGGDWLDQVHGPMLEHGETIYASALLYNSTVNCLPLMNAEDQKFYAGRSIHLKNAIESVGFDSATGRYIRFISADGQTRIGSSQDNRVFSDLAMVGLHGGFDPQRVANTLLSAYNTNNVSGARGNLVYMPSYTHVDHSLGAYTTPSWAYDNKVWGRVCAIVTTSLKRNGLAAQAEDNFAKCLPSRQDSKHTSPFNYLEYTDPRGNVLMPGENGNTLGRVAFSNAVDDSMNIWAQAQLADNTSAPAIPALTYPDGTLIKIGEHNIYVIENGLKRLIASWEVFNGLGYQEKNVVKVSYANHSDGAPLTNPAQRHVRGTMAIDANGVGWFLGQNERQPFPSYEVLQSWGGSFAQLVPLNGFDAKLPVGPVVQMRP